MKLEELLNKLIEKGWKPFGTLGDVRNSVYTNKYFFFEGCADGVTLRQIVSKESGLWQFVCKNGMVKENDDVRIKNYQGDNECDTNCCYDDYEYRIIESALCNEDKLEKFLLENIKIS